MIKGSLYLLLILGSDEIQPLVVQMPYLKEILVMTNVHYGRWQHLLFPFTKAAECCKNPDMDCRERLPNGCHYKEKTKN